MCKVIEAVMTNGGGNFTIKEIMVSTTKMQHEHNLRMEKKMDAFETTNQKAHEKLSLKIEETAEKKVGWSFVKFFVPILTTILGGIAALLITLL